MSDVAEPAEAAAETTGVPSDPVGAPPPADLVDACAELQRQMDELLGAQESAGVVQSLDSAVASLKDVERRNVSSVQLVALDG